MNWLGVLYKDYQYQDGRVVKALDLRSNGQMPTWVRTPLLVFKDNLQLLPSFCSLTLTKLSHQAMKFTLPPPKKSGGCNQSDHRL